MNPFYLAPPIFFVIAFVFSMLGMGGSQLYIPILFWMGMDFKTEAVPLGMLLNVVNSSSAAITYARSKLIAWRVAVPFAVAIDNDWHTWRAYKKPFNQRYWPSKYFIDRTGNVRHIHIGEGHYGEQEEIIKALLAETAW